MEQFHARLKRLREERGMTKIDLAVSGGIFRQAIEIYEAGRSLPGFSTLVKLARALDCSLDYLMRGDENE